jgi:hypothetical protein
MSRDTDHTASQTELLTYKMRVIYAQVPGKTPWERLDNAVRTVLAVPKDAVRREEAKLKKARHKKRPRRKAIA